jgi:hypothetical protein
MRLIPGADRIGSRTSIFRHGGRRDATGVAHHQAISQSATLEPWRQIILVSYITLIVGALLAGRARNAVTEDT